MKIKKIVAVAITIIFTMVVLTGCTTYENFYSTFIDKDKAKTATIIIGVFEPVTGSESKEAVHEIRGIQLANEVYPNIDGKIVKLVYGDNASDLYAAESSIKNLITYNPSVILGSYGNVYSMVAGPYIDKAKIPSIAISNMNPLVTKNFDYYYRVCYVDANQGDLLGRYVLESEKGRKAGVLVPKDNDAAQALANAFTDRIEVETGDDDAIKSYQQYDPNSTDYTKELENISKSGVKYVLLTGEDSKVLNIIEQAEKMKLDVTFLGNTNWSAESFRKELIKIHGEDNIAYVTFVDPTAVAVEKNTSEEMQKFLDAYHEKYGNDAVPDDKLMLGYDAYLIAIRSAAAAGDNPTGEDIKKVLDGRRSFQGVSGEINFNHVGDPITTAYISTISGTEEKLVYTLKPIL